MAVYSHTRLECFRRCPRQFFYRYVERLKVPEAPDHIGRFFGSQLHGALELLYRSVKNGIVPPLEAVLGEFREAWNTEWHADIVINEEEMTGARYRKLGERLIRDYYTANEPFNQSTVVDVERDVVFPLDQDGKVRMRGVIDRLAKRPDGVWEIHDYKSDKRLPTQADKDQDPQLAYYEIGIRTMWPTIERVELRWHYLRFGESIVSVRTPEQLEEVRDRALETVGDIESRERDEEAFPPVETALCAYCDFQAVCPVRKHLFKTKDLPVRRFRADDGVRLVDQWTELEARRGELREELESVESEIEELKAALVEFADREGASVVGGSEREVAVDHDEAVLFPRKTHEPEQHEELEQRLRKSDWWPLLSSLDRHLLVAAWKKKDSLDPQLRRLLQRFVRTEPSVSVRLRRPRGR